MKTSIPLRVRQVIPLPTNFGLIYKTYCARVYAYFLYRVGYDHELAKDLTQETFLRAFKSFPSFKEEGYLYSTYLMTIAHNVLVNQYRKAKSIPWSQIETEQIPVMADDDGLEAHIEQQDLARAIEHLSPLERRLMAMAYVRGMPIKEIGHHIHRTTMATKLLIFRIRNKIRKECGQA